ncbi:DUF4232 domain-containing protein [Prauserella cavernicola]|uniref:DUF4232 domain-containing protein n=1 Tax=Prauserella cavernicola TaxID=2800127 RepID=A0A934QW66_9PSEU|nr:DUF4232 domain-containing protein [Prauserella cavernicola]MBK1789397.1 DUF4232 domain-containing protein [Prauserella cavernicola]
MNTTLRTIASVTAAGGIAAGTLFLGGGAASAMPSDKPCDIADVNVSISQDEGHAAGHEAFVLHYTAANPTINCQLDGFPSGMTFTQGSGHGNDQSADMEIVPDRTDGSAPMPVNLRAGHPAESRIVLDSQAPVTFFPDVVNLNLPAQYGDTTTVAWPEGAPLTGYSVTVTDVSAA